MSGKNGGKISVRLQDIRLHPLVERQSELLASLEYVLHSLKDLSVESLQWLLVVHPIFVTRHGLNGFHVICGIRSFNAAARVLPASTAISVELVVNQPPKVICNAIYADLYLTPLVQSLRNPAKSLSDIYQIVPEDLAQKLTPGMSRNRSAFSKALGVATNTLYYRHRNRRDKQ